MNPTESPFEKAARDSRGIDGNTRIDSTHMLTEVKCVGRIMSRKRMFFSAEKAVRELGLPQTPVEEALARAVSWFEENSRTRA